MSCMSGTPGTATYSRPSLIGCAPSTDRPERSDASGPRGSPASCHVTILMGRRDYQFSSYPDEEHSRTKGVDLVKDASESVALDFEVIAPLEVHPEALRGPEVAGEP